MRGRLRKLIDANVIIEFTLIYALTAIFLAQARTVQETAVLIQVLCYAALGTAWIVPVWAPLIGWREKPGSGT